MPSASLITIGSEPAGHDSPPRALNPRPCTSTVFRRPGRSGSAPPRPAGCASPPTCRPTSTRPRGSGRQRPTAGRSPTRHLPAPPQARTSRGAGGPPLAGRSSGSATASNTSRCVLIASVRARSTVVISASRPVRSCPARPVQRSDHRHQQQPDHHHHDQHLGQREAGRSACRTRAWIREFHGPRSGVGRTSCRNPRANTK